MRSDDRDALGGVCAVGRAVAAQSGAIALAVARQAGGRRERERGEREEDEECGAEHCESDERGAVMYSECGCVRVRVRVGMEMGASRWLFYTLTGCAQAPGSLGPNSGDAAKT